MRQNATRSLKYLFAFILLLAGAGSRLLAQTETEPNNVFGTANPLAFATNISGGLCNPDNYDYFRCILPAGGKTIRLITTSRTTGLGQTGGVTYYLYDKFQSLLDSKSISLTNTPKTDTLNFNCFEGDTFYVLAYNSSLQVNCKQYSLRVENTNAFTVKNDAEDNDLFANAVVLPFQTDSSGHLGSERYVGAAGLEDNYDYYRCVLPPGGKSIRIITRSRTVTAGTTGGITYYLYNRFKTQMAAKGVSVTDQFKTDTLNFNCFEGDTFYVLAFNSSLQVNCKEYTLRYDHTYDFTLRNDAEQNDLFTSAVPLPFGKDTTGHLGSEKYVGAAAVQDNYDYYRVVQPPGGKTIRLITRSRTINKGTTGGITYYLYNKFQNQLAAKSVSLTDQFKTDTLNFNCFEGDTFFVVTYNSSLQVNCKEYSLRCEPTYDFTLRNDAEHNDLFTTAIPLPFGKDTSGHLGSEKYVGATPLEDNYDYYRVVLPPGGKSIRLITSSRTVNKGTTGGITYYLYNKFQTQLTNGSVSVTNQFKQDTLDFHCFEGDTFYVLAYNSSLQVNCKEYSLRIGYTDAFTVANDTEPNESLTTATPIALGKDTSGHLGSLIYTAAGTRNDIEDYYRCIIPQNELGISIISSTRTVLPGATGSIIYYIHNKAGANIASKSVALTNQMKADTFKLNCFVGDTFYVRVYSSSNQAACKEYRLKIASIGQRPQAGIAAARTGNAFGFVAKTQSADSILWDFGNGQKSANKYPSQTFGIGVYNVVLKARNNGCNMTVTDTFRVEVKGVEKYLPHNAGTGGDQLLTVYGGGLDSLTQVKLIRGSQVLLPFQTSANNKRNMLSANFNLHFAPPGLYDVEITIAGQSPVLFAGGFKIDSFSYPYCQAEVTGPSRWRIDRETAFELRITNSGNVTGSGVLVAFAYPKSVDVVFMPKRITLDRSATTSIEHEGKIYSISNAETALYADSSAKPVAIDTLAGKPYDGYLILFKIPKVPPGRTVSMPFKATTKSTGNPAFATWTYHPNYFGSCETPHWSNLTNMWAAESIDFLDMAAEKFKAPGLFKGGIKALKIGQKHLSNSGALAGAHFDAWYNEYEMTSEMYGILSSELDEANAFALKTGVEELVAYGVESKLGGLKAGNDAKNSYINNLLAKHKGWSPKKFDDYIDRLNSLSKDADRLEKFNSAYKNTKDLKTLLDKINTLQKLAEDCPELEPQLIDLLEQLDEELEPQDPNNKPTQSVRSMDPNAIYGPEGVLEPRYRKDAEVMHYMVTCENVDTASAPAQAVRIVDTLDPQKFDLSTFEFGNVYIGKKTTRLLSGRDEFFGELSLYPEIPLMARIIARLDRVTGVITWDMVGIDTLTGALPGDPDLGLLPPNTAPPMGEAIVNYSVRLKPGLPSGTAVHNRALIYFDENEPIATNTWSNTLDIVKPESSVLSATLVQDTIISLRMSGIDAESGIAKYRVYVQTDTGGWQSIGFVSSSDTISMTGERGKTYRFYVSAIDHVGNPENKTATKEAEITVPLLGDPGNGNYFSLYPNPSTGELFIRGVKDLGGAEVTITDFAGRRIRNSTVDFKAGQPLRFELSAMSNGIYMLTINQPGGPKETHKILVVMPK